jgi:hypothetical protein
MTVRPSRRGFRRRSGRGGLLSTLTALAALSKGRRRNQTGNGYNEEENPGGAVYDRALFPKY